MGVYFREYSEFLSELFPTKMQKLTVNAGFTCPNRDGSLARGGCIYCNNQSFSPAIGGSSVASQLKAGKRFFGKKYPEMRYLAYFQSYTSTYAPIERLFDLYSEALSVPDIEGLIIGTRPDCVPNEFLEGLSGLGKPVILEFGAETTHNNTLELINRCHTWEQTVDAVQRAHAAGIPVGLHFIMGLPGESEAMMLESVAKAASLPISTIKFHQLQIVAGTALAHEVMQKKQHAYHGVPLKIFEVEDYIKLCVRIVEVLCRVNPAIAIDRFTSQAPTEVLIAPKWGLKNYQFVNLLNKALAQRFNA